MADMRHDIVVAAYDTHEGAEAAIRTVAANGLELTRFSIVGRGYHSEEQVVGFYGVGDRIRFWGTRGACWGGLWGLLFGGLFLTIPMVGAVVILGPLAAMVFAAIESAVEGAVVVGGLGALGAALYGLGIPHDGVLLYERALKADQFLVVVHGPPEQIAKARLVLHEKGPVQLDHYAGVFAPVADAA